MPVLHVRAEATGGRDPLEDYGAVKSAIQQAFIDSGATLSHHHAVGTERAEWLEQDISGPGAAMARALFESVDRGPQSLPGEDRLTLLVA